MKKAQKKYLPYLSACILAAAIPAVSLAISRGTPTAPAIPTTPVTSVTPVAAADIHPDSVDTENMTLRFADEFNGTSLNTDVWGYDIGNGIDGWGNWEKEYYTDRTDNVQVSDGSLKIIAKAEEINGYHFSSGRISTREKQIFGNGYIEARIRLPSEAGVWPAFWMLGVEGTWPRCGEIDILESKNTENRVTSTVHWEHEEIPEETHHAEYGNTSEIPDKTQWHTYGVYRTYDRISCYIDGQKHYEIALNDWLSELRQDFYILLNVACGGLYTGDITPSDTLNAAMEVDYVRYYTDKTAESAHG